MDLEHGRTDAVLLDDIIVARYVGRHPSLTAVADVAEGRYAIALRPADVELRAALDQALGQMIDSRRLATDAGPLGAGRRREQALAAAGGTSSAAGAGAVSALPLTLPQLLLFAQGALVTLLLSLAAMALAAPFGLALALLRLESPPPGAAGNDLRRARARNARAAAALSPLLRTGGDPAAWSLDRRRGRPRAQLRGLRIGDLPGRHRVGAARPVGGSAGRRRSPAGGVPPIILPQALRLAVPGVTNDFISLLKDSSLVSVLTVVELTKRMTITAVDNRGWLVPGALCAALYFALGFRSRASPAAWTPPRRPRRHLSMPSRILTQS